MTRKKARGLMLEVLRRVYLKYNGNLRGFGKVAAHYRDEWRPNFAACREQMGADGYKEIWNSETLYDLRHSVNM